MPPRSRPSGSGSSLKGPSRGPKLPGTGSGPQDKQKARAQSGYELRKARKANSKPKDTEDAADVYEFKQHVSTKAKGKRRAQVGMDLDRDEAKEFGDEAEDDDRGMEARLLGSDEELGSEDDEELDSDAAFEEEDEERYAGFFGKGYKAKGKDIDLSEGDEDEDDEDDEGEEDEFLDVLDIMDGRAVDKEQPEKVKPKSKPKAQPQPEVEDSDDDEDMDDEDEGEDEDEAEENDLDIDMDEDDDMGEDGDMEALTSFVNSLPTKRKPEAVADDEDDVEPINKKKRRILPEHQAAGPENEFRALSGDKLTLDDLMSISGKPLPAALPAPLPLRAQERVDREAAYATTKAEVDKWGAAIRRVHDAEFISFPLQGAQESRISAVELAASFKPRTAMESGVDALLKAARLRDEDVLDLEESRGVTVEEVRERRNMLRERRELMFRAEQKMKRVKKIKSRVYRRLHRDKGGKGDDEEEEEEDREKMERDRAKERATLRHKNTGRWARPEDGQSGRQKVEEMLERGEKLRRRIQGKGDESSGSEDDDEEHDAFDELEQLRAQKEVEEEEAYEGGKGKKMGVMDMKFMRDAMKRKDAEAQGAVDSLIREIGGAASSEDEAEGGSGVIVERTGAGGRAVYRPGAAIPAATSLKKPIPSSPSVAISAPAASTSENPWLAPAAGPSAPLQKSKKNTVIVDKNTKAAARSVHKLKSKTKGEDDSAMEISADNVLTLSAPAPPADDDVEEDETVMQETLLQAKGKGKGKGKGAFEQRDLVKQAFAGDDVVREFAALKAAEVERDAPKVVDNTLPGWGAWGGAGFKPDADATSSKGKNGKPKPKYLTHIPGTLPSMRADAGKANVIISQKVDKKFAEKYMVKDLPFPYTSKAQYDAARGEGGLGREWNTRIGFQKGTRKRVTKKPGQVIEPLEKLHS